MHAASLRALHLAIALLCYLLAIKPMLYFVGFLANRWVGKTIDGGPAGSPGEALVIDTLLVLFFVVAHSLLARPAIKARIVRHVPELLERPLYSGFAGLQFVLLIWGWRPWPTPVWSVEAPAARAALEAAHWSGWAIVVAGVFALGSARLYGLRPVWESFRGRPPAGDELARRGVYRLIRHPLYSGTILALWATPTMSAGRALLAALFTAYILVGRRLEERDLLARHGASYAGYRLAVGTYLPRLRRRSPGAALLDE